MRNFNEFIDRKPSGQIFESHEIEGWESTDILEGERIYGELMSLYESEGLEGLETIEEGFLSTLLGGAAGFVIGPSIGKVIAKALGIQKGIFYDMMTSRLVGAALGAAITKSFTK